LIAPLLDWIHFWRMEEEHTVGRLPANTKTSEQHKQQSTALPPQQRGQRWANPQCGDRICAVAVAAQSSERKFNGKWQAKAWKI
jgi:hypothetical protein